VFTQLIFEIDFKVPQLFKSFALWFLKQVEQSKRIVLKDEALNGNDNLRFILIALSRQLVADPRITYNIEFPNFYWHNFNATFTSPAGYVGMTGPVIHYRFNNNGGYVEPRYDYVFNNCTRHILINNEVFARQILTLPMNDERVGEFLQDQTRSMKNLFVLYLLVHVAEEHSLRTPGSSCLFLGYLAAISNGDLENTFKTFKKVCLFVQKNGASRMRRYEFPTNPQIGIRSTRSAIAELGTSLWAHIP